MVMVMVNIYELKAKLSEYVEHAQRGERVLICKRNQPVAELVAIERKRTEPRPMTAGRHRFDVPTPFFEPMPEDFLEAMDGAPVYPERSTKPARAAEGPERYGAASRPKSR
jgi:prevent-host-death family protein